MNILLCVCIVSICVWEGRSGQLFYEFYRVLAELRRLNPADRHLFWLYENVSSMQACTRETISRFFAVKLAVCYQGCTGFDYFKSGRSQTWSNLGTQTGRSRSQSQSQIRIWEELVLWSENNTPDETNGVNNAGNCCKDAVQFRVSFITSRVAPNFGFGKSEIRPFFPNSAKIGFGQISGRIWPNLTDANATAIAFSKN